MPYSKTTWKDRAVEHPRTYTIQDNGDGTITLVPAPGTVYEQGTPVNAANLNKIEQGIADATVLAEGALQRSGGTLTGVVTANLGIDGASNWGTFSSNSSGNAMFAQNAYLHPTDGTFRYRKTHASLGARGIVFLWSIPTQAAVPHWFDMGRIATTADATFTPNFIPIITSAGNQTINGRIDIGNFAYISNDGTNEFAVFGADTASGGGNRLLLAATDLRVGLSVAASNSVWHTGQLRNNNGVLELYHGGVWTPVGGIKSVQRGSTSTYTDNSDPENPVPVLQVDVPISAVNTNKAFVVITSTYARDGGGGLASNYQAHAQLLNSTTVRINATVTDVMIHWQVVESY